MQKHSTCEAIEKAILIVGSQQKLAKAIGVTQGAVQKWLAGKQKPRGENVALIEAATDYKVKRHEIRPDQPKLFPPPTESDHDSVYE